MSNDLIILERARMPSPPNGYRINRYGELLLCTKCGVVGTDDDFDQAGLTDILTPTEENAMAYEARQCLSCGEIMRPVSVKQVASSKPTQMQLFA